MKTVYTYNEFLNERLRDQMTPKSDKDIIDSLNELPENEKFREACENGVDVVVKQMLENGFDDKDTLLYVSKNISDLIENGFSKVVILLLNHGIPLELHKYNILNDVDLGEIENELDEEGQYESGDEFETELQNRYEERLKSYILSHIFSGNKELPDNFYELLDTMEILEEKSKNEFFKSFKLKIDEPVWF
jgi:glutaredoxin-related protein